MPAVTPEEIQALVDKIGELRDAITTAGNAGRTKMQDLGVEAVLGEVPLQNDKVDEDQWKQKKPEDQEALAHRLTQIRDSLHAASGLDGPSDPTHIMHPIHADNWHIVIWGVLVAIFIVVNLGLVVENWDEATGTDLSRAVLKAIEAYDAVEAIEERIETTASALVDAQAKKALLDAEEAAGTAEPTEKDRLEQALSKAEKALNNAKKESEKSRAPLAAAQQKLSDTAVAAIGAIKHGGADEQSVLLMVVLLGALGGSLHFVGSLVKFVGNRQLMRSWLMWYLSMPFAGAALAPIVYMLLRVGLLSPSGVTGDGSTVSNLNLIGIYAFAALTGVFSKTALEKLGEVFKTVFRTGEPSRDPLSNKDKPGTS